MEKSLSVLLPSLPTSTALGSLGSFTYKINRTFTRLAPTLVPKLSFISWLVICNGVYSCPTRRNPFFRHQSEWVLKYTSHMMPICSFKSSDKVSLHLRIMSRLGPAYGPVWTGYCPPLCVGPLALCCVFCLYPPHLDSYSPVGFCNSSFFAWMFFT